MSSWQLHLLYFALCFVLFGTPPLCRRLSPGRLLQAAYLLVPAALVTLFLSAASEPRPQFLFSDFSNAYYPAGRLVRSNPFGMYDRNAMHFVNVPILAYLFTPLSQLREPAAQTLFTFAGVAAVAAACWLLCRLTRASGWNALLLVSVVLSNGPLYYSLREGNLTHFVLLLLVGTLVCPERGRDLGAGVLLGLVVLIKIPLFLLVLHFLLRRQWRVLAGASGVVLLVCSASMLLFGYQLHKTWREECIRPFAGRPLVAFNNQSLSGFLARAVTDADPDTSRVGIYESWKPVEVGGAFRAVRLAFLCLAGGATVLACCRPPRPRGFAVEGLELGLFLCLALLVSPISWTHYYLLLLVPLCLCLGNRAAVPDGPVWTGLLVASAALVSPPVLSFAADHPVARTLLSHYFFGGVLLWAILMVARIRARAAPGLAAGRAEGWNRPAGPLSNGQVLDASPNYPARKAA
jgi:hypothetical protein